MLRIFGEITQVQISAADLGDMLQGVNNICITHDSVNSIPFALQTSRPQTGNKVEYTALSW